MVAALGTMKGVDNRELYLKISLQASDPVMAKIITESAVMTAGYHKHISPLKRLAPIARLARAEKKDGTVVLALPADHIIWSEKVASLTGSLMENEKITKGPGFEVWVSGDFSKMARTKLEKMGWKVNTKVRSKLLPAQK